MTNRYGTLILLGLLCALGTAQAQTYPSKTITIVVTAAAGGVTDVVARAIGQRLSEKWGQQVVIENRGGGGHILGAQAVAKAAPDGHTLMVAEAGTYVINPNVYPKDKLSYDVDKDLIQITGLVRIHHALVATPSLPVKSLGERGRAGEGEAGHPHLWHRRRRLRTAPEHGPAGARDRRQVPHRPLPRRDAGADRRHRRAHQHDADQPSARHSDRYEAGKVKMLAVGSPKRLARLPDVPTAAESVPGYTAGTWFGLSATAGHAA